MRHTGQIVLLFRLVYSPAMFSSTCLRIADHRVVPGASAASVAGTPTDGSESSKTVAT